MEIKTMGEEPKIIDQDEPSDQVEVRVDIFTSTWGHVKYAIVTSQDEVNCLLKTHPEATMPDFYDNLPPNGGAVTHLYKNWAVVHYDLTYIDKEFDEGKITRGDAIAGIVGIIAHEAYHVCEKIYKEMGEQTPSSEFAAYTLQTVVSDFMGTIARKII